MVFLDYNALKMIGMCGMFEAYKKFTARESLVAMIDDYIYYYNNERLQRNLGVVTPMTKYNLYLNAA